MTFPFKKKDLTLFLISVLNLIAGTTSSQSQFDSEKFDSYVQEATKDWNVPGLSIAVVKDDSTVFLKAYGIREVGKKEQVDAETIFKLASTTKAFTSMAIAILVDEGRLDWDDRVNEYLPHFELKDKYLSSMITIRDLLTHQTGIRDVPSLHFTQELSVEEIIDRLKYVDAAYPLRSTFEYNNQMYAVAGEVIKAVTGKSWAEFLKQRILEPLEMNSTFPLFSDAGKVMNSARPHFFNDDELEATEYWDQFDNVAPAGSMASNAVDMAKWIKFLLNDCKKANGETLLDTAVCQEMFRPHIVLKESVYPTAKLIHSNWNTYGMGWFQQDYEGRKVDFHTGSIYGTSAIIGMIRDEKLGVFIAANKDHAEIRHALMYRVFDLFDEEPAKDWSSDLHVLYDEMAKEDKVAISKKDSLRQANRKSGTSPKSPLSKYTGNYESPLYGKLTIIESEEGLEIKWGNFEASLNHWHYDTFSSGELYPEYNPLITFNFNSSGQVKNLQIGDFWEFEKLKEDNSGP